MLIARCSKYTHIDAELIVYSIYGTVEYQCTEVNKFKLRTLGPCSIYTKEIYDASKIKHLRNLRSAITSNTSVVFTVLIIRSRHTCVTFKTKTLSDDSFIFVTIAKMW